MKEPVTKTHVAICSDVGQPAAAEASRTISAHFSPIIIHGMLVLPETIIGMIEASATRKPCIPRTCKRSSTTERGSTPILQVPEK